MTDPYTPYYVNQAGHGMPVFTGGRMQRGHGLGSIFGGLARLAMPLIKKTLPVLKRQAFKTGSRVLGDVLKGRSLKTAAKQRLLQTGSELLDTVTTRPIKRRAPVRNPRTTRGRIPRKRVRRDIFD